MREDYIFGEYLVQAYKGYYSSNLCSDLFWLICQFMSVFIVLYMGISNTLIFCIRVYLYTSLRLYELTWHQFTYWHRTSLLTWTDAIYRSCFCAVRLPICINARSCLLVKETDYHIIIDSESLIKRNQIQSISYRKYSQ